MQLKARPLMYIPTCALKQKSMSILGSINIGGRSCKRIMEKTHFLVAQK